MHGFHVGPMICIDDWKNREDIQFKLFAGWWIYCFFGGGALQNSANGQNPPKRSKEQMEVVDHLIFEVRSATYILLGLEPSPIPWVLSLEGRNEKPGVASQPSWKITV